MTTINKTGLFSLLLLGLSACGVDDEGAIDRNSFDPGRGIAAEAASGRTMLRTPHGDLEVGYDVVGGRAIMEGDIDLGTVTEQGAIAGLRQIDGSTSHSNTNLIFGAQWPSSTIFYAKPSFNVSAIVDAVNDISAKTHVKFVQLPGVIPGLAMIQFTLSFDPDVSSSPVGYQGGVQSIQIWPTHGKSVVEHEVLHALGMWHEQQRIDRDIFINLNLGCVPINRWHNFDKAGLPIGAYDFSSIMHYDSFAFSFIPGCATMTKKNGDTFSRSQALSTGDIASLNILY